MFLSQAVVVLASLYMCTEGYVYGLTRFGSYGYPTATSYVFNSRDWPSVKGLGFESTCWGCRGKRSADADSDADAEPGYLGYGYGGYGGYGLSTLGYGLGYRLNSGVSYTQRSPQGLRAYRPYFG